MNKQLSSILQTIVAGVVTAKILTWMGDDHPSVTPTTNHHHYIHFPGQRHATAHPVREAQPITGMGNLNSLRAHYCIAGTTWNGWSVPPVQVGQIHWHRVSEPPASTGLPLVCPASENLR